MVTGNLPSASLTQIIPPYFVFQTTARDFYFLFYSVVGTRAELVVDSDPKGQCRLKSCAVEG